MIICDLIGLSLQDNLSRRCFLIFAELDYSLLLLKTTGNHLIYGRLIKEATANNWQENGFCDRRTYKRNKAE